MWDAVFGRSIPRPLAGIEMIDLVAQLPQRLPSLIEIERSLIRRLTIDAERRARRLARRRAICRFARSHALWYQSLFDERLLLSLPDDFMKRCATSLARAWATQFPYYRDSSRERDVRRLEPVAREFLQILAEEEERLSPYSGAVSG